MGASLTGSAPDHQDKIRRFQLAQGDRQALVQPAHRGLDLALQGRVPEELGVPPALGAAEELQGSLGLEAAAGAAHAGHGPGPVAPG